MLSFSSSSITMFETIVAEAVAGFIREHFFCQLDIMVSYRLLIYHGSENLRTGRWDKTV